MMMNQLSMGLLCIAANCFSWLGICRLGGYCRIGEVELGWCLGGGFEVGLGR